MKKSRIVIVLLIIVVCAIAFFVGNGVSDADKAWKDAEYTENTEFGVGNKTISFFIILPRRFRQIHLYQGAHRRHNRKA